MGWCHPLYCIYGDHVIYQRYVLAFMTFFAIVHSYNMRMCLHIAITEIAKPTVVVNDTEASICPNIPPAHDIIKGGSYEWSEEQQAIILLAFFPGYLIMHVPGGILADRYGGRHVLSLGVLISAIITMITPPIITHFDWKWVAVSRFFVGVAQAPLYSSITSLLARWVPERQRSRLGSLVYSGIQIGIITGIYLSGLLISFFKNWPIAFYVWGAASVVWYVTFLVTCYSEPRTHPYVTEEEDRELEAELGIHKKYKTPWKEIFKDAGVWALIWAQAGHDWITYTVEVDFPKYLKSVLKFPIAQNGIITAAPFAGMWICSTATGWLSDYIVNKHDLSIATMRKIYTTISSAGPSILVLIAMYMGCDRTSVVIFYCLGMISMGPYYPGLKVNVLDISLNFSGILMSLANGFGVITGIIAPYLVAVVAKDHTLEQWQNVFWLTFVICTITNVIYIIWATGDRAEWDKEPELIE